VGVPGLGGARVVLYMAVSEIRELKQSFIQWLCHLNRVGVVAWSFTNLTGR